MSNRDKSLLNFSDHSHHEIIQIGHGNFVLKNRVVAICESGSNPMKRFREKAESENILIDATAGRKTRSIIIMDSRHVVLSALSVHTLSERLLPREGTQAKSYADLELQEGEFVS